MFLRTQHISTEWCCEQPWKGFFPEGGMWGDPPPNLHPQRWLATGSFQDTVGFSHPVVSETMTSQADKVYHPYVCILTWLMYGYKIKRLLESKFTCDGKLMLGPPVGEVDQLP